MQRLARASVQDIGPDDRAADSEDQHSGDPERDEDHGAHGAEADPVEDPRQREKRRSGECARNWKRLAGGVDDSEAEEALAERLSTGDPAAHHAQVRNDDEQTDQSSRCARRCVSLPEEQPQRESQDAEHRRVDEQRADATPEPGEPGRGGLRLDDGLCARCHPNPPVTSVLPMRLKTLPRAWNVSQREPPAVVRPPLKGAFTALIAAGAFEPVRRHLSSIEQDDRPRAVGQVWAMTARKAELRRAPGGPLRREHAERDRGRGVASRCRSSSRSRSPCLR
jgi:hypothetical protein